MTRTTRSQRDFRRAKSCTDYETPPGIEHAQQGENVTSFQSEICHVHA